MNEAKEDRENQGVDPVYMRLTGPQVLMRSDGEAVAINLPDLDPVETPEGVKWIDPTHANLPDHHHHHHDHGHDHSHT